MAITACRGTVDILPAETTRWRFIEETAHRLAQQYGYREMRTPAFEVTELFTSSLGEDSDIVEKELYTFRDRSGRSLTLRPEFTVPAVRAYLEHNLGTHLQFKTYYVGEIWRYERPQSGRLREAHQFGVEVLGSASCALDAELVDLAMAFLQALGLKDLRLEVNSLGCKKCRPAYQQVLREFFQGKDDVLCQDCERRRERNPLRVLDCRRESCLAVTNTAPTVFQSLCPDCRNHFFLFKEHLGQMGYAVNGNPRVVHSMGYYTRNVWQIASTHLGSFNPLCTGGRYDDLVAQMGSSGTSAAGLAVGIERTIMAMEKEAITPPEEPPLDVFLVGCGEEAERHMTKTMSQLRKRGYRVERDYMGRGLKNQLKSAEKLQPLYTVMLGDEETRVSQVTITDNGRGTQENSSISRLVEALDFKLRRELRERGRDKSARGNARGRGREEQPEREPLRRGREEQPERGRREEQPLRRGERGERGERGDRAERPERGERGERERSERGRERQPRDGGADDDAGARFNEWAVTYSEAARSSGARRSQRRVPMSETALTWDHASEPAREAWGAAQQGLLTPIQADIGKWPAEPIGLAAAIPISITAASANGRHAPDDGNWLVEERHADDDHPDDNGNSAGEMADDDEGDDDGEVLAAVPGGAEGEGEGDDGDRRRRGGRRGGRRHGRRRARKS